MKHIFSRVLAVGLLIVAYFTAFLFLVVTQLSHSTADAFPELAYMRIPVLVLVYVMLAAILLAIIISTTVLFRNNMETIFSWKVVKSLWHIAHLFAIALISNLLIILYGFSQVGLDLGMPGFILYGVFSVILVATMVLYFIASLFKKAVRFKEENEMTV